MHYSERYPNALHPELIGTYPALAKAGGGYVWDAVLEYRVWCHPVPDDAGMATGGAHFHVFESYSDAQAFQAATEGAQEPVALVLQREYIDEPSPGNYVHVKEERLTEWPVDFLDRPLRTERTIPAFLAPDAPPDRLDIIRGVA